MKIRTATLVLFSLLFFFACTPSHDLPDEIAGEGEEGIKSYPAEEFFIARAYPDRQFPLKAYTAAMETVSSTARQRSTVAIPGFDAEWTVQGPANIGARVNTIATHPSNEDIIYIGYSGGGAFKTIDGGTNWTPIFDDQPYLSIGDITLDPDDPETIYIGTGDPNISGYPFIGNGIYKSTNGGDTWTHLGLTDQRIISRIVIDPFDSDIIYVACMGLPMERNNDRGLYKSIDGGNTWSQVLFISDQTGIADLLIDPSNPSILYAATWTRIRNNTESIVASEEAGVYKSTDGGNNWTLLGNGLPTGELGRVGLAMSSLNSNTIFALYVGSDSQLYGIYKSTDGGASWTEIPTSTSTGLFANALGGFGWYFGQIRVSPTNDDHLYMLGVYSWFSFDSGNTWSILTPTSGADAPHVDNHDLVFNHQKDILLATDGGLYKREFGFQAWNDIESIPTTQFYRVAYDPHNPESYYGGSQDNGSLTGNAENIEDWERILGGDGFQVAFHPTDPNIVYAETQRGNIWMNTGFGFSLATAGLDSDDRRHWDMQYLISQNDPNTLYTGTYRAYRSISSGFPLWEAISPDLTDGVIFGNAFHTISSLSDSPFDADLLYYGTTDGNVWRTPDNGNNWESLNGTLPDRYVTSVKASPADVNRVFVTHSGYRYNEYQPHVHRSDNRGDTWVDITGDLPAVGVNDIIILPNHDDQVLFAATDAGVYGSVNGGVEWERLGSNMPIVNVYDLVWNESKNEVVAATFGRSIMSFPLDSLDLMVDQSFSLGGNIVTEFGDGVDSVSILQGGAIATQSNVAGDYAISGLMPGENCDILPKKNINFRNGVSTFDIIKITEHILTLDTLDSPYKLIAADINNSGIISTFDLVNMRKVILFIQDTFPDNESWRFVTSDYVFPNPANPFETTFPSIYTCNEGQTNLAIDFIGIKVGDVNGDANPGMLVGENEGRNNEVVYLTCKEEIMQAGERYTIPVSIKTSETLKGLQFTLSYEQSMLQFLGIDGVEMGSINAESIGLKYSDQGQITFSWDKVAGLKLKENDVLFSVIFEAQQDVKLSDVFTLNSSLTTAECYDKALEIHPLRLDFGTEKMLENISVVPNPFSSQVSINFDNKQTGTFTLRVFDLNGKQVFKTQKNWEAGNVRWNLAASLFPNNGIYTYHIQGVNESYSGKMVKIE